MQKGVVRIKELGLPEGHPQKDGELVDMASLVPEVQKRLSRKRELDGLARQAEGLRVVGGMRGEDIKPASASAKVVEEPAVDSAAAAPEGEKLAETTEESKPAPNA